VAKRPHLKLDVDIHRATPAEVTEHKQSLREHGCRHALAALQKTNTAYAVQVGLKQEGSSWSCSMWVHENEPVTFAGDRYGWKNWPLTYATGTVHIVCVDGIPKAQVDVTVADEDGIILDLQHTVILNEKDKPQASNRTLEPIRHSAPEGSR